MDGSCTNFKADFEFIEKASFSPRKTLLLENRESLRAVAVKLDSMELEDVKKFRVIQGENELSFSKRICLWQV
jgi:hypothetical protein